MAYQPKLRVQRTRHDLQQQKLKWLISLQQYRRQSDINLQQQKLKWLISHTIRVSPQLKSTIVEIKMAYQPTSRTGGSRPYLQQQKLKWLISRGRIDRAPTAYLQQQKLKWLISLIVLLMSVIVSTIVEIKMAYQPSQMAAWLS